MDVVFIIYVFITRPLVGLFIRYINMFKLGRTNWYCHVYRKNMQRNKQVAMGRKKFNMDPKKVGERKVL